MTTIAADRTTYAVHHGFKVTVFIPNQAGVDVFIRAGDENAIRLECEHHRFRGCAHVKAARREIARTDALNRPR